jgi:hypothetical protein
MRGPGVIVGGGGGGIGGFGERGGDAMGFITSLCQ